MNSFDNLPIFAGNYSAPAQEGSFNTLTAHAPLASSLTTLYNTLADLHVYERDNIVKALESDGSYAASRIPAHTATQYGFNANTVIPVVRQLPYLQESMYPIAGEVYMLRYVDNAEDAFENARGGNFPDEVWGDLMHEDWVVLTWLGNDGGPTLLYDSRNQSITEWDVFEDHETPPSEKPWYGMNDPRNCLYRYIAAFITLDLFHLPQGYWYLLWSVRHDLEKPRPGPDDWRLQLETAELQEEAWQVSKELYEHEKTFRDLLIECGWNVRGAQDELLGIIPITFDDELDNDSHNPNETPLHIGFARLTASNQTLPLWERLERARLCAVKNFDSEKFFEKRDLWVANTSVYDREDEFRRQWLERVNGRTRASS